jgi:hypothetical protein
MSDETLKYVAMAVIALCEVYALGGYYNYSAVAAFWDWVARVTGRIANVLGFVSVQARLNYITEVNVHG